MKEFVIRPLLKDDWPNVKRIYIEGIVTGLATFETKPPQWEDWNKNHFIACRLFAEINGTAVGYAALTPTSSRYVYRGVAEVSIYISDKFRGQGLGKLLLNKLIQESEANGFWTLQAVTFSKNLASINLHLNCGFRIVGIRNKIGQLNGEWFDNHLLERRSAIKN